MLILDENSPVLLQFILSAKSMCLPNYNDDPLNSCLDIFYSVTLLLTSRKKKEKNKKRDILLKVIFTDLM